MYLYILHIFPQEKIMDKSLFLKIIELKSAGICIELLIDFISTIHSDSHGCKVSPTNQREFCQTLFKTGDKTYALTVL